ncbi:MAG TPA: DUF2007 domain-containing protein [Steroidobacteraceae bacterium]|nr:DUF2007 domain-containing protein [Steroidobacteraceae bacterium]
MENLTEKVYECTLAVEAHMMCDLLSQAGISARVEGAFLTGAGGELPLGNTVNVRVDPVRAAEAREVIAEWEKSQPGETPAPVVRAPRFKPMLWFLLGALAGATVVFAMFNTPRNELEFDFDGDGFSESRFHYIAGDPAATEYDRNGDQKIDERWGFHRGFETGYQADNDFDGRFEWQGEVVDDVNTVAVLDLDGDGEAEQVRYLERGVLTVVDFYARDGGHVAKRQHFNAGLLESAEFDDDGDGVFERRVGYDRFEEPRL